jgi:uncharacterized protein DUF6582
LSTSRQKAAARRNIKKARSAQSRQTHGAKRSRVLSTRQKNRMPSQVFAFPKKRKEPLNDARHVRNAVARFDQVVGVTAKERDNAWRRIRAAARKFGVHIEARGWRSLMKGRPRSSRRRK